MLVLLVLLLLVVVVVVVVNYLIITPALYTAEDFISYKDQEAFSKLVCGWARDISTALENMRLVKTKAGYILFANIDVYILYI